MAKQKQTESGAEAQAAPPVDSPEAERLRVLDDRRASLLAQRQAQRDGLARARTLHTTKGTPEARAAFQRAYDEKMAQFTNRAGKG